MGAEVDSDLVAATHTWIDRHNVKKLCPLCGLGTWKVVGACEMSSQLRTGTVFPVIPLVCSHCAYTAFLAAAPVLNALPPDP